MNFKEKSGENGNTKNINNRRRLELCFQRRYTCVEDYEGKQRKELSFFMN